MGVDTEYNNIYDLEDRYHDVLFHHMRRAGTISVLNACMEFGVLSVCEKERDREKGKGKGRCVTCNGFWGWGWGRRRRGRRREMCHM